MDLQMPVMDGYEATIAIRTIESLNGGNKTSQIPIIAMTANAFTEDVAKCKNAGMNDHLAKPVDVEALLGIANKYLNML
jgi:CheY-like chemotaxis protein